MKDTQPPTPGIIRVGIGGWTYAPWRGSFYPAGLPQARELEYAAGRLSAIEINATFYGRQKPDSFAKWAAAVPDGFVFALKASRYSVTRPVLAEAGPAIADFFGQGLDRLGNRIGPILWQLPASRKFAADDIAAFLDLLPAALGEQRLRHVVEASHPSFRDPAFAALGAARNVAVAYVVRDDDPPPPDLTADFVYVRLESTREEEPLGCEAATLDRWAETARGWATGGRDVYLFVIAGAKERAPAAAEALIARLRTAAG